MVRPPQSGATGRPSLPLDWRPSLPTVIGSMEQSPPSEPGTLAAPPHRPVTEIPLRLGPVLLTLTLVLVVCCAAGTLLWESPQKAQGAV